MRPGAGRKPKPAGERRDRMLMVRLTAAELVAIKTAARGKVLSDFVRKKLIPRRHWLAAKNKRGRS